MLEGVNRTGWILLAALALGGVAEAQPGMAPNTRMPPPGAGLLSPADYVMKAGAGDLYEKRSSQLVLQSRSPGIRRFARMMVADHTRSTNDIKVAAMKSGVRPMPPMLEPKQAAMIRDLERAGGPERDRLYLDQQRAAHTDALMLHQTYSRSGDARPLRMVADKIVPVVEHHIDLLRRM